MTRDNSILIHRFSDTDNVVSSYLSSPISYRTSFEDVQKKVGVRSTSIDSPRTRRRPVLDEDISSSSETDSVHTGTECLFDSDTAPTEVEDERFRTPVRTLNVEARPFIPQLLGTPQASPHVPPPPPCTPVSYLESRGAAADLGSAFMLERTRNAPPPRRSKKENTKANRTPGRGRPPRSSGLLDTPPLLQLSFPEGPQQHQVNSSPMEYLYQTPRAPSMPLPMKPHMTSGPPSPDLVPFSQCPPRFRNSAMPPPGTPQWAPWPPSSFGDRLPMGAMPLPQREGLPQPSPPQFPPGLPLHRFNVVPQQELQYQPDVPQFVLFRPLQPAPQFPPGLPHPRVSLPPPSSSVDVTQTFPQVKPLLKRCRICHEYNCSWPKSPRSSPPPSRHKFAEYFGGKDEEERAQLVVPLGRTCFTGDYEGSTS